MTSKEKIKQLDRNPAMYRSTIDYVDVNPMSSYCYLEKKTLKYTEENSDNPFIVCDIRDVYEKHRLWRKKLPRVKPFYAVKCNDDPVVLQVMADLGMSFDCASKGEIEKILNLGVHASRIIYANPVKQPSFLKYAVEKDVSLMTFDNTEELHKIKQLFPEAKLLLRILPPICKAVINLGIKFGCPVSQTEQLLMCARRLGLDVVGVSFHVGTGCNDAEAYALTIKSARDVFDIALNIGYHLTLLDIGGGFPGHDGLTGSKFEEIADVINCSLDQYFPVEDGVEIIAEPGTYFVESAFTVCARIIGKRLVTNYQREVAKKAMIPNGHRGEATMMYYVTDGFYGSFNIILHEPVPFTVKAVKESSNKLTYRSMIWGPTCDSADYILKNVLLPEMAMGDWIYFENMGAYSITCSTAFNGMPKPSCFYICHPDTWSLVYPDAIQKRNYPRNVEQIVSGKSPHGQTV